MNVTTPEEVLANSQNANLQKGAYVTEQRGDFDLSKNAPDLRDYKVITYCGVNVEPRK